MSLVNEYISVSLDQDGVPANFNWRGSHFEVKSRPIRWFARAEWWSGERAHLGIGSGAIEVEMWRFSANCDGVTSSVELLHTTASQNWKLRRIFFIQ